MISRSALSRGTRLALRSTGAAPLAQRRGLAAATGAGSAYQPVDVAGVKTAVKDDNTATTRLAIVAKAGTRYQPVPGLTVGLEEFAFKNTTKRSALRIVRESELLGGQLTAYHTREALVVEASFLKGDLPYFAELLAEIISETKYTTHEFHEVVESVLHLKQAKLAHNPTVLALDAAHSVAFHTGLGSSVYPSGSTPLSGYLNEHTVAAFAESAYAKSNIAVVADGTSQANLSKWIQPFFSELSSASPNALPLNATESKYYGGEQRTSSTSGNALVIGFPGNSLGQTKAENSVLLALLGGESNVKWSPGFTLLSKAAASAPGARAHATNLAYSDAGLLAIQISGSSSAVRKAAQESIKALKSVAEGGVSKEDLTKAIAKAKFDALTANELSGSGLVAAGTSVVHGTKPFQPAETLKSFDGVTAENIKAAAKELLDGKASVSAVGDLHVLPFAEELGLKV